MEEKYAGIEALSENLYRIEVPLPNTPLKSTNSYYICDDEGRGLIIDTGFNHSQCQAAMRGALNKLGVNMGRTDLFITHLHSDHSGLAQFLACPETRVFMSRADGEVVAKGQDADFWESFREFYRFTGLEAGGHVTEVAQHPGFAYAPPCADNYSFVEDGHEFAVGGYRLRCVLTPGHTRGHLCLYEPEKRLLFSGDHILGKITPNITQMSFDHDALAEFFASLALVGALAVDKVYPGHRHRIDNLHARIEELRRHHQHRLEETLRIVGDGRVNTVEVTRRMQWSLTIRDWDDYPPAQKLFSAGEALAHLHHLENRGELVRWLEDGVYYFSKAR